MNKPEITYGSRTHPLLKMLPEYLKDPANYEEVQKKILNTIMTTCSHAEMIDFAKCPICTDKMVKRRKLLKELGFKNAAQYMAWKKVHETIKARMPLVDWKANKLII